MCKIISVTITIIGGLSVIQAGFLGSPLGYSTDFQTPLSYSGPHHFGSTYTAPHHFGNTYAAPHHFGSTYDASHASTTLSAPHAYAVGYSAPPIVKYHSGNPFTAFGSIPSITKFAHSAAVATPSFYNSPLPYGTHPALAYNGYSTPNTVVKYGPPITTTTTTYSTTAPLGGSYANPLNVVAGW